MIYHLYIIVISYIKRLPLELGEFGCSLALPNHFLITLVVLACLVSLLLPSVACSLPCHHLSFSHRLTRDCPTLSLCVDMFSLRHFARPIWPTLTKYQHTLTLRALIGFPPNCIGRLSRNLKIMNFCYRAFTSRSMYFACHD